MVIDTYKTKTPHTRTKLTWQDNPLLLARLDEIQAQIQRANGVRHRLKDLLVHFK